MRTLYLVLFIAITAGSLFAQPVNDECVTALHIPQTDSWCSGPGAYTNVNATPFSGSQPGGCFLQFENEVWFTFIPQTPALYVRISGAVANLGTLQNPAVAIFEGSCNNLQIVGCNIVSATTNQVELSVESLVIGAVYYLLVEGQNMNTGTFQICVEGFIPPPIPQSDCGKAVILCDKSAFVIDTILGIGIPDPGVTGTCLQQELSSVWYKWTAETSGTLTFTLTPNGYQPGFESDDIDFVVYELPNGIDDCSGKIPVRCVASGANTNEPFQSWQRCNGPTGLELGDPDITEPPGCQIASQNNFAKELDMVAGKSYALLVNNFSQSGLGFSIEWGGTGTFLGPEPAFDITAVQAFECDKTIIFDNQSVALTDSIVKYEWGFGVGANPLFDTTAGPVTVVYESFGPKKAVLTVTSSKGCVVSKIVDLDIAACCADTSTLDVMAITTDQLCPGTATGVIQGVGISGAPAYQFSLDCVEYQPSSLFPSLLPGTYTLCIQDEKGCTNEVDVEILPSDGLGVDAGDTIFVQLGNTAQLNAIPFPVLPVNVTWSNAGTLTFNGSDIQSLLSPIALPKTTGWYTVTTVNEAGCVSVDSVLIVVDPHKPVFIPNVITPNNDGINDQLTVYANIAATGIEVFQIYDRWGGLMWEGSGSSILNNELEGWDGTYKGQPVSPGVYAYRVVVEFLDDIPVLYTGTVTVVK